MEEKKTYHHRDLRGSLVNASIRLLEEHGPDRFSLREAARAAGVSAAAVGYHFAGVAGLLTEVAARGYARLADAMEAAIEAHKSEDCDRLLTEVGLAYIAYALENRGAFQVMFRKDLLLADDAGLVAAGGRAHAALLRACEIHLSIGDQQDSPPVDIFAAGAWSIVHGASHLVIDGKLAGGLTNAQALAFLRPVVETYAR